MITLKFVVAGEHVIRDADTNKVSVINVIDDLTAEALPLLLLNFGVLTVSERVAGDPDEVNGTVRIMLGEAQLIRGDIVVNFRGQTAHRHVLRVQGLVVPAPGRLVVQVTLLTQPPQSMEYAVSIDRRQADLIAVAEGDGEQR